MGLLTRVLPRRPGLSYYGLLKREGRCSLAPSCPAAVAGMVAGQFETDMHPDIEKYNAGQEPGERAICVLLAAAIDRGLPGAESKLWHAHPVWFLEGNPIVGYSKQKPGIRLMFWSGADFGEAELGVVGQKFKDASVFYREAAEINQTALRRWLKKAQAIQWDYKNLVRRKGRLERLR